VAETLGDDELEAEGVSLGVDRQIGEIIERDRVR